MIIGHQAKMDDLELGNGLVSNWEMNENLRRS